jgi:selenocysteine lyase/cysteine desulfurase
MKSDGDNCYLDHATTSRPKAPRVVEEVVHVLRDVCVSPGRSHHFLAQEASDLQEAVRKSVATTFGAKPVGVILTCGATHALNLAIKGLLHPGDHVVATCFDHNSVLRPLKRMESLGCKLSIVRPASGESIIEAVVREFRPETKLLSLCHASNVSGTILPVKELGIEAQKRGIIVLLDAAQSAGHVSIDLRLLPVDFAVISGHKGLLGPPGIGCLLVKNRRLHLEPLMEGGTGYESANLSPPPLMPTSFEVGTQNLPAIAGFGAALRFAKTEKFKQAMHLAKSLETEFLNRVTELKFVRVHRPELELPSIPVVSLTVNGQRPDQVSAQLDQDFGIQTRAGLHCAPLMHDLLKTSPWGTVRVAFGFGNQSDAADRLYDALKKIGNRRKSL